VNFDNINTIPRHLFRRRVTSLSEARLRQACRHLASATGC
jgi:mRNA interferase MazF